MNRPLGLNTHCTFTVFWDTRVPANASLFCSRFQVYNGKDLAEEMTKIQSVLSDDKNDWEHRVAAVRTTFWNLWFWYRLFQPVCFDLGLSIRPRICRESGLVACLLVRVHFTRRKPRAPAVVLFFPNLTVQKNGPIESEIPWFVYFQLKKIRSIVQGGALEYDNFVSLLRLQEGAFKLSVSTWNIQLYPVS